MSSCSSDHHLKLIRNGKMEKLCGLDLSSIRVKDLIESIKNKGIVESEFEIIHSGKMIRQGEEKEEEEKNGKTLQELGLRSGSRLYLLHKPKTIQSRLKNLEKEKESSSSSSEKKEEEKKEQISDPEISSLFLSFSMILRNPSLDKVLKKWTHFDRFETLYNTCPQLIKDPVAVAYLCKPALLFNKVNKETFKKFIRAHPALEHVIIQLVAAVNEESGDTTTSSGNNRSYYRGLDEMSEDDDDDMMMEQGNPNDLQRNASLSTITPAALAAAINAAQQHNVGGGSTHYSQNAQSGGGGNPITMDAFRRAMNEAFTANASPSSSSQPSQGTPSGPPRDYTSQINTMREMGIIDEGLATRALDLVGGDLQAAIDLIFSGWNE